MRDELILANLIRNRVDTSPNLDVLTFVAISKDGEFIEEIRSYQQLWEKGQRIAAALAEEGMTTSSASCRLQSFTISPQTI